MAVCAFSDARESSLAVFDEIVKWASSDLPPCQAEAVRRLLVQGALTPTDKEQLFLLMKDAYGLLKPEEKPVRPEPLYSGHPWDRVNLPRRCALRN